jgi:hypothetical protein
MRTRGTRHNARGGERIAIAKKRMERWLTIGILRDAAGCQELLHQVVRLWYGDYLVLVLVWPHALAGSDSMCLGGRMLSFSDYIRRLGSLGTSEEVGMGG